ncbi:hypothetical protein M9H77_22923 [Catharanthus roseus]|uniref:Uncharacterized protein n=1 Tax=Catharanthus roseus TaxID=4058 RepID=A0ACC0ATC6_CATRO|nr:hypothetical protein M9H77_22923 [Catharanthus roseus]
MDDHSSLHFELLLENHRYDELTLDFKASQSAPVLPFSTKIMKHVVNVYTPKGNTLWKEISIWRLLLIEIDKVLYLDKEGLRFPIPTCCLYSFHGVKGKTSILTLAISNHVRLKPEVKRHEGLWYSLQELIWKCVGPRNLLDWTDPQLGPWCSLDWAEQKLGRWDGDSGPLSAGRESAGPCVLACVRWAALSVGSGSAGPCILGGAPWASLSIEIDAAGL